MEHKQDKTTTSKVEHRVFAVDELELREDDSGTGELVGHAALFNTEANLYFFRERIIPGAFKDSIVADDIRALVNHDSNLIIGRNKAGTLHLEEDERGLKVRIFPPDTQVGRDIRELIRRGDINQMSFGFTIESDKDEEWDDSERKNGKLPLRTIKRAKLWDVSPVTYPAYQETDIAVRSYQEFSRKQQGPTWRRGYIERLLKILELEDY